MRPLLLGLLLLIPLSSPAATAELYFELKARIRSFKVDADLMAGARLLMEKKEGTLVLLHPLEHPWKFYWVAPLVGREEVKYASEVTLPAATWPARKRADAEVDARGRARWAQWRNEWSGRRDFTQAFNFYVIGSPRGRFVVELMPRGGVSKVENRVTDRWLPTGLADWVAGRRVEGYAFWANEPAPPEWQPHAYDALQAALHLLAVPVASGQVVHPDVVGKTRTVLETLAPKARGHFSGHRHVHLTMSANTIDGATVYEGKSGVLAATGRQKMTLTLYRKTVINAGRPVSDEVRVEFEGGKDLTLQLSVGWLPTSR